MVRCENPIHGTGSSSACGLIVSHSVPPGRTLRSNSAPRPHRPGRMHAPLSTPRLPLHEPLLSHLHFQREPYQANRRHHNTCRYPLTRQHPYTFLTFLQIQRPIAVSCRFHFESLPARKLQSGCPYHLISLIVYSHAKTSSRQASLTFTLHVS
ncbi:hypothetical protein PSPO01_07729 [Paraphaeosphaeria sporulosa]